MQRPVAWRRILRELVGAVAAMTFAVTCVAQTSAAATASSQAASVVPEPSIRFDAVSIRQSKDRNAPREHSAPRDGDGMTFTNVPMAMVILGACNFNNPSLAQGLPDWTLVDRYDVMVKVTGALDVAVYHTLTPAQRRLMLRRALEDRLKLKAHLELRPEPVYDLIVAKGGPKMKVATPGDTYPNGFKAVAGQTILFTPPAHLVGQGATMAELASRMSDLGDFGIGHQVFDKTGLAARYDFSLQWTPDIKGAGDSDSDGGGQSAGDTSGPSLFTAMPEQLGLKLNAAKEPVQCLIVDHAERPAEN
jgi:uncharacterized protein (TIGR03435 family)